MDKVHRCWNKRSRYLGRGCSHGLLLLGFVTSAWTQTDGVATSPSSTVWDGDFSENPASLAIVPFITWSALLVGIIAATMFYVFWRRRLKLHAFQIGAVVAVILAMSTQLGIKAVMLNAEQKDCLSAEFGDENTSEQSINCGSSRERAANAFGLVSRYAEFVQVGAERNRPISAQVLGIIDLGTLVLLAFLGYAFTVFLLPRRTIEL